MRNEKPIIQKRQSFRTAITKNKNWQKIRQRRPQMAGNTPTFVLVVWYNIDVIRWMPQRFLCAVNCIHSKETFFQRNRQFSDYQQIAWVIRTEIKLQASKFRWYEPWKQNIPGYRYVDPWKERICGGATMAKAGAIHATHEPARRSRRAMIFTGKVMRKSAKGRLSVQPGREREHGWHHGERYFLTASRWLGRSPCNVRQPGAATAKRGYDVISQITACNTPGSRRENQPGSRDEIRQKEALMTEKKFKKRCMKVQIEWNSITGRYIYDDEQSGKNFLEHVLCKCFKTRKADQSGWICGNNTK